MPIYASAKSDFKNCPPGVYNAVCVDVQDLGIVQTNFGNQHTIRIVFQVDERDPAIGNKRFIINQRYNCTLSEKANLRNDLEAWRGRKFTPEELERFDLEKLLGVPAMINVVHKDTPKGTFANIASITPLPRGMQRITCEDYIRKIDRPTEGQSPQAASNVTSLPGRRTAPPPEPEPEPEPRYEDPGPGDDDDIPF